jgi:alkyldihydroxyacetonephosphate synthase
MTEPRLKHFGWGREGSGLTKDEEALVLRRAEQQFGPPAEPEVKPPRLDEIKLAPPRLQAPHSLPFCTSEHYDRVAHTYGKSFPEYTRGLLGD